MIPRITIRDSDDRYRVIVALSCFAALSYADFQYDDEKAARELAMTIFAEGYREFSGDASYTAEMVTAPAMAAYIADKGRFTEAVLLAVQAPLA